MTLCRRHAQKWTLFSPDDTEFLYPTRLPFEESRWGSLLCA